MSDAPDWSRIAGRVAHALRQAYGARVREVSWETTEPTLVLDVELLGPVDAHAERMRMAEAIYDIAVAEGVTIVVNPYEAGRTP